MYQAGVQILNNASAFEHLEYLVNRCGDRRVGTPGNRQAAAYITRVLELAGFQTEFQEFKSPGGIQAPNAVTLLTGFLSSFLLSRGGRFSRAAGIAVALTMAAMIAGEDTTLVQPAHWPVARTRGRNVIARAPGGVDPRVVVVAHFDTVNEGTAFHERVVRFVPLGFRAYATFPLLSIALSAFPGRMPGRLFRLAMLAGVAGMLQWQFLGGYNPGANDNGSSVGVALEAASKLGSDSASRAGAWFIFTDGEEAGITGMKAFLKKYRGSLERTMILNLESQGVGELCYMGREGMLIRFKPPAELIAMLEESAGTSLPAPRRSNTASFSTDALAALARGLAAITLVRLNSDGFIEGWHYRDRLENIDTGALEDSVEFLTGLMGRICDSDRGE